MKCPGCGKTHRSLKVAERCNSDAITLYNRCVISGDFPEGVKENYIKARSYLWHIKNGTRESDLGFISDAILNYKEPENIEERDAIAEYEELLSLTFPNDDEG